jgi:hypothetical protein
MDTKTLKVGDYVYMVSAAGKCWGNTHGKVLKITPSGVEVQNSDGELIRFDTEGKELDESRRDRLGFGPSPSDKFYSTLWAIGPEFQPWYLAEEEEEEEEEDLNYLRRG